MIDRALTLVDEYPFVAFHEWATPQKDAAWKDQRLALFETFDIVVVPFSHSDRPAEKRRHAIVVSSPHLEELNDVVWLAMITSSNVGTTGAVALTDIAKKVLIAAHLCGLQRLRHWRYRRSFKKQDN